MYVRFYQVNHYDESGRKDLCKWKISGEDIYVLISSGHQVDKQDIKNHLIIDFPV